MLVIRRAQMKAFEEAQWSNLVQQLADHLKDTLPGDYDRLGEAAARSLARRAIERGREYGMETQLDFFRFFNLLFLLGADFDREPWASEILSDRNMQGSTKLEMLEYECREQEKWV
jgi:hypothetical protein